MTTPPRRTLTERPAPSRVEWTFAMVDLAGFTALTEAHGDEDAADLAVRFAGLAAARLGSGDRLVKEIGDAVLLASRTNEGAFELVRGLMEDCSHLPDFPVARAGLHRGPAVERNGDLFGAAVNLTARVAGQAAGGQVLATAVVADAARATGVPSTSVGTFDLRNVAQAQELFDLALCPQVAVAEIDPVCRMRVTRDTAAGTIRQAGREYRFCSLECLTTFAQDPSRHLLRT